MTIQMEAAKAMDIRQVLGNDTTLRYVAGTDGGEYAGPCPFCGGRDRFRVWPAKGRYWCRQCDRKGDAIQYVRDKHGLDFPAALAVMEQGRCGGPKPAPDRSEQRAPLQPPSADWQVRGFEIMFECQQALWDPDGVRALAWLRGRGFTDKTILGAQLGYNRLDRRDERARWGLSPARDNQGRSKQIWLPRGIVIPWEIDQQLWRLNIRRPLSRKQIARSMPKYMGPAGNSNALYNADALMHHRPVVLLEGELDACIVQQEAGDLVSALATGSTAGARRIPWIAALVQAPVVLVAFDSDDAGEGASRYWIDVLPNARRWRPYWGDANSMALDGADLRGWVRTGLAV